MFELGLNACPLEKDWTNMILRAGQGLAKGWPRAGQGAQGAQDAQGILAYQQTFY